MVNDDFIWSKFIISCSLVKTWLTNDVLWEVTSSTYVDMCIKRTYSGTSNTETYMLIVLLKKVRTEYSKAVYTNASKSSGQIL